MATVSPPQPWSYTLELPRDPRAPGVARTTLRAILRSHDMPQHLHIAQLLASELVTNTWLHTDGPCTMRLRGWEGGRLRVSVWDASPFVPPPFGPGLPDRAAAGAEAGRGLWLVQMCASKWGSHTYDKRRFGKSLWFELLPPRTRRASTSPVGCTQCVDLEAARRRAVAGGDRDEVIDATIAVRSHFRHTHLLPEGCTW
ncbi:anti-sigma regulatory factor (Ser/Thr protein kinase) [Streptomyces olivoverticillatus]|uniref:Anti-sigma regulatory factor (Ser/Thr protein kinase) n=1 Tax=Streptomyces olivoverticillatus TaxID=66427 RepID=A0A7W7LLX9_9ACTN|nr:ATP-binding protein [Streptomyces olivoverticillatus]MBB4892514.1 anti-sigma regulatory factor (Ser/Thr protein kinase) [Streptomyces olivoverticillatus]